ncbi:MAG: hypothetical protein ABW136_00725 [Steroidobacteraceae bacterium]
MSAITPLGDLLVLNRRHAGEAANDPATLPGEDPLAESCAIRTCLREVLIGTRSALVAGRALDAYEVRSGAEAYGFLLRLACGLESEIAGETEILGQIKQSWREHEQSHPLAARRIRQWMQRLLQETKEVRSEHVLNLGSATYGSLARRLLGGRTDGATLLVGAGQLAATVLPYLPGAELSVWNRTPARAFEMLAGQRGVANRQTTVLPSGEEAELAAWHDAHDVVLCIPGDAARDPARIEAWNQRRQTGGKLLHLGILSAAGTAWEGVEGLSTLGDLFALRDAHAEQRDALLSRARRACFEKAQLAQLDDADGTRPGSSSHGWEDLAVFIA